MFKRTVTVERWQMKRKDDIVDNDDCGMTGWDKGIEDEKTESMDLHRLNDVTKSFH